jgi:uncharacterized membrane protein
MDTIKTIISIVAPLVVLDALWLYTAGSRIYPQYIKHLMGESLLWTPIVIFYILYAIGLAILVVRPALIGNASALHIFGMGCLLGLVAYGAYDLTNHATLRDWHWQMTVIDMAWGALVTGLTAYIGSVIARLW